MTYQLRRAAKRIGDGEMELEWPMIWEEHYLEPYFSQDRQSPFAIQHPLSFVSELCFDAGDAAWKLDSAAVEASKRHPWVEWKLKPGAEKDVWSQRTEVVLKVGSYPKEEYEGYQRALEGMLDVFSHKVVLRKAE